MNTAFLKTGLFIGFLTIVSHGHMSALKGAVIAMHSGSANPTTEGFANNNNAITGSAINGDTDGTVTFDAFQVVGGTTNSYYVRSPTSAESAAALSSGWKMTVNLRFPEPGPFFYASYFDSLRRWDIFMSSGHDVAGDRVWLWDNTNGFLGGPSYDIPGARGRYHFLELIYDVSSTKARLYVDGTLAISNFAGGPNSASGLALFGSTSSFAANVNLYKVETGAFEGSAYVAQSAVPEPSAFLLGGGGLVGLWLRRKR